MGSYPATSLRCVCLGVVSVAAVALQVTKHIVRSVTATAGHITPSVAAALAGAVSCRYVGSNVIGQSVALLATRAGRPDRHSIVLIVLDIALDGLRPACRSNKGT